MTTLPWWDREETREWCDSELIALLDVARRSRVYGGFGHLDARGELDSTKDIELWITCRMTHVFALAHMAGHGGAEEMSHGIDALRGPLRDSKYPGWFSSIDLNSHEPLNGGLKQAYAHAFVVLAASSAHLAGEPRATVLLDEALAVWESTWFEESGLVAESMNRSLTKSEPYRGINANMHTVEALLAASDATGRMDLLKRALHILNFVIDRAAASSWLIAEHYSPDWSEQPDYNADHPADPFRPWGYTPGHGFEWSRLVMQALDASERQGLAFRDDAEDAARSIFNRAVADSWYVDGKPGFVYTVDNQSRPSVADRMHWVLCEAVNTAIYLGKVDQDRSIPVDSSRVETWIDYARTYLIEEPGMWWHELTPDNLPGQRTWPGKPDAYHVAQMLLMPRCRRGLSFAADLALPR